ncbi:MAG: hypothetical protein HOQ28_18010 [Thermoleophilia bacterium]|nr:hypothetical protein [Thermoleophilia bacterium]
MTVYDEIAGGLVDSQIESIELDGESLAFVADVAAGSARAWWQCAIVAAIAADLDPQRVRYLRFSYVLPDGTTRWDGESAIYLHRRGPIDVLPDSEIRARLKERAEITKLVFHRPLGRVAVEFHAVVDERPPNGAWEIIRHGSFGEGHYYELVDRNGRKVSYGGHSTRMLAGMGSADGRTGLLG